ncbi:glycosyltransferase [Synechococcus sp. RSCCF101]|uniref:glycosyltransferase n=1 Tax=Synechococcus sp. RSCCF101 TaxID=2511069 RepID=UPI001246A549|nr:glycosyltransferase [Synechococcus sp. RSCCF101]QEY31782.1 glycosyltransferase [Synechococcus sp. RSCCF101]
MRVLLVHQNFPAQFRHLLAELLRRGDEVAAVGARARPEATPGLRYLATGGQPALELRASFAREPLQAQLRQARRARRCFAALAAGGWQPDVVLAHPFWGDVLLLDDVFPAVPLLAVMELDLAGLALRGGDRASIGSRQLLQWAETLASRRMAAGLTATAFQQATYPAWLRPRLHVIHEGIDTDRCAPDPFAVLTLPDGGRLSAAQPVLSFAARSLEHTRGIDRFVALLPELMAAFPELQVVIAGREESLYGSPPPGGGSWLRHALQALPRPLPWPRLHLVGHLPHDQLLNLFRISSVHCYLSRPYVLSWSLLEAMSCGALVLAGRTPATEEVIEHGRNGLLVPAGDPGATLAAISGALQQPAPLQPLRLAARRTVAARYGVAEAVERQLALLRSLAAPNPHG